MENKVTSKEKKFTSYQIFIIAILAILQFSIILDFMVLSPLGAQLMKELNISTEQFGWVVSAYAFSAGASGLLAAGFADKFDRKTLLLFFYTGFIIGTLFCGMAPDYPSLLAARVVTGIFGGVIGSIGFAIITDLFPMEVRGQVMGFVQMAFASSQIMGIPVGLYLANHLGWHSPFLMIVGISILIWIIVFLYMQPIDAHLKVRSDKNPFLHLAHTISQTEYLKAFASTALLATGGFMLMPFGSAFSVHNLGLSLDDLPMIYMVTGVCAMIAGPVVGKVSDKIGKYRMFCIGSAISGVMIFIYCHLGITPLWTVIPINVILFVGISSRMISSSALVSAVPLPQDRGAFMGVNSSIQQISGGIASAVAGLIVVQKSKDAPLEHYDILSYVVIGSILITVAMMYMIHLYVTQKVVTTQVPKPAL